MYQHWFSELAANRAIQVNYQAWGLQKTFAYILSDAAQAPGLGSISHKKSPPGGELGGVDRVLT